MCIQDNSRATQRGKNYQTSALAEPAYYRMKKNIMILMYVTISIRHINKDGKTTHVFILLCLIYLLLNLCCLCQCGRQKI